jgi:cytoskeletal protein CcmA (bactofilin family)
MSSFRRITGRTFNKVVQRQDNMAIFMKPISRGQYPNYESVSDASNTSLLVSNGSPYSASASSKLTFDGTTLNVTGNLAVSGNTHVTGNLDVSGNKRLRGNLYVPGNTHVAGNLDVSGNTRLTGNLDVSGNTRLTGNLYVPGNTRVTGNLDVSGNTSVTGNVDVSGNTRVTGNVDVSGNTRVTGNLDVSGNTHMTGNLDVSGSIVNTLGIVASTVKSKIRINAGSIGVLQKNTYYLASGGAGITWTLPLASASVAGDAIIIEYDGNITAGSTHRYGTTGALLMKDSSCYVPSGGRSTYTVSSANGTNISFLLLTGVTNGGVGAGTYVVFTFNGELWRVEARCTSSGVGGVAGTSRIANS